MSLATIQQRINDVIKPGYGSQHIDMAALLAEMAAAATGPSSSILLPEAYGAVSGVVSSAQRALNLTALNDAGSAAIADGKVLEIPAKTYEISGGSVNWMDKADLNVRGLRGGMIKQYTDNIPIIKLGHSGAGYIGGQRVGGLTLEYANSQAAQTGALALWLGGMKYCRIHDFEINKGYTGVESNTTSGAAFFSNIVENIVVRNWTGWAMHIENTSNTGSIFDNIYCINGGVGTQAACLGGVYIQTTSQIFIGQLNVEWAKCSVAPLQLLSAQAAFVAALNFEGLVSASYKGVVRLWTTLATIDSMMVNNCKFAVADGAGSQGLIVLGDNGEVDLRNLWVKETTRTGLTLSIVGSEDQVNGQVDTSAKIGNVKFGTNHNINQWEKLIVAAASGRKRHPLLSAGGMLVSGGPVYAQGDADLTWKADVYPHTIFVNVAITAGRTITLSNTTHATTTVIPPTGARVRIIRGPLATGAFNLLVKDNSAATLATLAAINTEAICEFNGTDYRLLK